MKQKLITLWVDFKTTGFYKTHKEELLILPILFGIFILVNFSFTIIFPHSALFDVPSQIETLSYFVMRVVLVVTVMWMAYRFVFPPFYARLSYIYHNFSALPEMVQNIIAVAMLAVFLLAGAIVSKGETRSPEQTRADLKKLLDSQLYIRETTANRGKEVDLFNLSVKAPLGSYWCAAYVSYDLTYLKVPNPNSAWSPNFAKPKDIIWTIKGKNNKQPLMGDVFTEYYKALKRVGHTGFYLSTDYDGYFVTQAGNTSGAGSRNGDRVGRKKIPPDKIFALSRFIF